MTAGENTAHLEDVGVHVTDSMRYLGLSGEGSGLRGGGVRGTAALGAMEAAGSKP